MKVLDASVVVDACIDHGDPGRSARAVVGADPIVIAPTILRYEVITTIRREVLAGRLGAESAQQGLDRLQRLRLLELPIEHFAGRMWQLRENVTVFDAAYVAAAEATGATLVTRDGALASAPGLRCEVELLST